MIKTLLLSTLALATTFATTPALAEAPRVGNQGHCHIRVGVKVIYNGPCKEMRTGSLNTFRSWIVDGTGRHWMADSHSQSSASLLTRPAGSTGWGNWKDWGHIYETESSLTEKNGKTTFKTCLREVNKNLLQRKVFCFTGELVSLG